MNTITDKNLRQISPATKAYFIRDSKLKGFGVKVNPSGSIKFIAEVWYEGKSYRRTVGDFPFLEAKVARANAHRFISLVKSGQFTSNQHSARTLKSLFESYTEGNRLKLSTLRMLLAISSISADV